MLPAGEDTVAVWWQSSYITFHHFKFRCNINKVKGKGHPRTGYEGPEEGRGLSLLSGDILHYQLDVYFYNPTDITYISVSCCLLFHFRNINNNYNYFITIVYLLFVRRGLSSLLFLCIHVLPGDGWSGQSKNVVMLNKPNVQDLYSCVRWIIK
jgi:hypothetical protein